MRKGEHLVQFCASARQKEAAINELLAGAGERDKVLLLSDSERLIAAVGKRTGRKSNNGVGPTCLRVKDVLYSGGKLEPSTSLDNLRKAIESQREPGQTSLVVVIDMSWLKDRPEWFTPFMQVEVSMNLMRFRFPVTFVCQYDTDWLPSESAETVNSVHAVTLTDGKLSRNFWLIPRRGGTFEDMGVVPEESQRVVH